MRTSITTGALLLGMAVSAFAEPTDSDLRAELDALKSRLQQQEQEIGKLRSETNETWLNERRAEEVKALIHDVLSDADTRSSLMEGGLNAGWRDGFFLASDDGNFLLRVGGQGQIRYAYNFRDDSPQGLNGTTPNSQNHNDGFSIRRAMLSFDGHLFDPRFTYQVSLLLSDDESFGTRNSATSGTGPNAADGTALLQNAWVAYEFADGWQIKAGQFKAPFLREELVHSSRQLAVERSLSSDLATVDYTQGIELGFNGEVMGTPIRSAVMIHDGSFGANTPFNTGAGPSGFVAPVEIAVAARAELLLAGAWEQFDDFSAWSGDSFGLMFGAAVDWEEAEHETGTTLPDVLKWTADLSAEMPEMYGLSLFSSITGIHAENDDLSARSTDTYLWVAQASVFVVPDQMDVFARYEYIDPDNNVPAGGADLNDIDIITVGTNYYLKGHAAKATLDMVWVGEDLPTGAGFLVRNGQNLLPNNNGEQFAIRGQFQFLF